MIKTYNKTILKTFPALLFVIVISTVKLFGQTDAKEFAEVDDLFLNDRFAVALPYYRNFLKNDSSNTNLNFKIGVCYLNSRSQKVKAIGYLEKAVGVASPIVAYKFLGDAYHLAKKFDLAIASYDKFKKVFLADKPKDISILEEVNWKIEMCRFGKKLQELDTIRGNLNTNSYKDKNAIKNINFNYTDYTSAMSLDQSTMTFTFQRPDGIKKKLPEDGKYFEDIYIPVKTNLIPAPKTVIDTTTNRNEASVATSVDGQIVLTYKDDKGDGNLYITRLTGNQWSSPEKLNKPVNTKGWESNEFISADGYTLYFTSNRAGGFGGKDIYVCKKLPDGEWGKATNLGPVINTPFDEEAPFIYSDGLTLFFSSNKNKQSCCFDIFSSTLSMDGTWTEPTKIGYPVKTVVDDIFYATTNHKEASSAAIKENVQDKKDTYLVTFIDQKGTPFTVLKGKVVYTDSEIQGYIKITVTDNETGEILSVYNSNYKTGDYLLTLPPGRKNNITYEADGYLFQSESMDISKKASYYEIQKIVQLSPVVPGSRVFLNNIFFDSDGTTLRSVSNVELNKLFLLLSMHPGMIVELSCSDRKS